MKHYNGIFREILLGCFVVVTLLLSLVNFISFTKPNENKVLGVNTENQSDLYWEELLTKHDTYIPGWIEIGRLDKAAQIDPNFFIK